MTTFTIKIDCDNNAFDPDPAPELVRILRQIIQRMETEGAPTHYRTIFDINGNKVGLYALKDLRGKPL